MLPLLPLVSDCSASARVVWAYAHGSQWGIVPEICRRWRNRFAGAVWLLMWDRLMEEAGHASIWVSVCAPCSGGSTARAAVCMSGHPPGQSRLPQRVGDPAAGDRLPTLHQTDVYAFLVA